MKRIGSEIPLFTDRIGPPQPWRDNWLAFSNGRAALAWFLDRWTVIKTVAVCAYTCPQLVRFLRENRSLDVRVFDVGAEWPRLDLAIVPALFGSPPDLDNCQGQMTVIDAAQTAFGHIDFAPPPGGAVLSCPRKCTELADGAVLVHGLLEAQAEVAALPVAKLSASAKIIARTYMGNDFGYRGIEFNRFSEINWPEAPHRMSDPSRAMLERLDQKWHRETRQRNADCLATYLWRPKRQMWFWKMPAPVPFSFPIFVGNRDELLGSLKSQRIFATALWPDAVHDSELHPNADWMARHLVSLPVDQRHDAADMEMIAKVVLKIAKPPPDPPKGMMRFLA